MLAALGCLAGAAVRVRRAAQAEADLDALRARSAALSQIVYIRPAGGAEATAPPASEPPAKPSADPAAERIQGLQRENPELVGWLTMAGAGVDYPVMQSPARPNFYLDHNFAGEESKSGLPYIDEACDAAGVNRIVYGHNMKNGTMFGSLSRYLDADFFAANAAFTFDTASGRESYRVIAAYQAVIDESAAFRFYTYTNVTDEESYITYVSNVIARSEYGAAQLPRWGQKLLTLVTCVRYHPDERLVIVAAETE